MQLELRRKDGELSIGLGQDDFKLSEEDIDLLLVALIAQKKEEVIMLKGEKLCYSIFKVEEK